MAPTAGAEIRTDFDVDTIPALLRHRPQWVAWSVEMRTDSRRQLCATKVPVNVRTGRNASSTNATTWAEFAEAVAYARRHQLGIGYVFAAEDPFTGVDLDKCRNPRTGAIAAWARGIIRLLDSYAEVSPSGTGVKVFIRAKLTNGAGKRHGLVEIYSRSRFFTITGRRLTESPGGVLNRQPQLDALVRQLFPPPRPGVKRDAAAPIANDTQLLERAVRARNGEKFSRLWRGDWTGDYPSQSEADAALCAMLAHWTAGDAARVDALFRQSRLYRPKWDRDDYRRRTIERVLH